MEANITESTNFLGGREEHQRHWNVPVPDRNAEQVPPEYRLETLTVNPSAWGHLNPSSYSDVGRLFYGVFKLWSKLQRKK